MEYREIPLTKGKVARVSPEDYDDVMRFRWTLMDTNPYSLYAQRHHRSETSNNSSLQLQRHLFLAELQEAPRGTVVSHRDGNGLNCVRSNLVLTTQAGNVQHDKDRNAMKRAQDRLQKIRDGHRYLVRLTAVNARLRADGISEGDLADRLRRPADLIGTLLSGSGRSVSFLADAERVLGLSPFPAAPASEVQR